MKKQIQPVSRGFSLVELMVSVAIIASLVAIMIPSVRSVRKSYESTGAKSMINSALASARAIAIKERKYAGIRFQLEYKKTGDLLERNQYMVFVIREEPRLMGNLSDGGFKAVEGIKPMKLPAQILIMDLNVRTSLAEATTTQTPVSSEGQINNEKDLADVTSFSIIFSPAGQLVTYQVRVRNRDGETEGTETTKRSLDSIFNTQTKLEGSPAYGMFIQDDYANIGLGAEKSKGRFWEISKERFRPLYEKGKAWSEYLDPGLKIVEPSYINAYTGEVIKK